MIYSVKFMFFSCDGVRNLLSVPTFYGAGGVSDFYKCYIQLQNVNFCIKTKQTF